MYSKIHPRVVTSWNVGRGRKSSQTPMDVFFMSLAVLKHGGSWDILSKVFDMKAPTFERVISGYMKVVSKILVEMFVDNVPNEYPMDHLHALKSTIRYFESAIEAVDVTFQMANRPSGNMQEGKKYFSGKHKLYGYKMEVAVRPNGLASAFSPHYPGSVSDTSILTQRISEHRFRTEKCIEDQEITEEEDSDSENPSYWAVLADKGYQGA